MSGGSVLSSSSATKQFYATSSPFEQQIGYYRAVRRGQLIYVSGSTATDPESPPSAPKVLYPGDARKQTHVALAEIIKAIKALGGHGAEDIIRTRMFVQRQEDCALVAEGFREVLGKQQGGDIGTTATMLVVSGFYNPDMLVEIECDAITDGH